jgi:hypothetical protein
MMLLAVIDKDESLVKKALRRTASSTNEEGTVDVRM